MTTTHTIEELSELGDRFNTWKKNNPHQHVPKKYWNEALRFVAKYGVEKVAHSIGYLPSYIARKQQKIGPVDYSDAEFVEMLPCQATIESHHIQVNIQNRQGVAVALSFHGDLKQLFPLITSLFKEDN